MIMNLKFLYAVSIMAFFILVSCSDDESDDVDTGTEIDSGTDDMDSGDEVGFITEEFFNSSSLMSFSIVTAELEDGTTADCYELTFSSNPVASGPFCPDDIDDIAGMSFYDGATNEGLRVWADAFLNDLETDGYDIFDEESGIVNVADPNMNSDTPINTSVSNCLEGEPDDSLELTFLIPVTPKLASSNNDIESIELVGLSVDGVPVNGAPPSAINGPGGMMGGGPGGDTSAATEVNIPSLDPCGGHQDPAGYYHWHLIPEVANQVLENNLLEIDDAIICELVEQTDDVVLSGFAKDGFPIYAYAVEPAGLDDCGGITASTAEFPDGIYHYVASTTSAPNVPACLKGVAARDSFSVQ